MTELHHWDFWNEFTAEEAAALIMGIDPGDLNDSNRRKLKPIISRMQECYQNALDFHVGNNFNIQECVEIKVDSKILNSAIHAQDESDCPKNESINDMLESIAMTSALDFGIDVDTWPKRKEIIDFNRQKFTRQNLGSWLNSINMKSNYSFFSESFLDNNKSKLAEKIIKSETANKSLLIMVIAMAIDRYKYDPNKSYNSATSEIAKAIQKRGMSLSDDTIRKYLKMADQEDLS